MPELSQNHYIEVNGYQIRYIEEGSGKPIIFQSGLGFDASCDQFIPTMKLLARKYRVISFDRFGWGLSDRPEKGYTFEAWSSLTTGFMDQLGIPQAVLVGHTLGGWVAALVAHQNPERVSHLILANTAGLNSIAPTPAQDYKIPDREGLKRSLERTFADALDITESMIDEQVSRAAKHNTAAAAYTEILRYVNDPEIRKAFWLPDRLQDISIPSLVVWGADDHIIGPEHGEQAAELLPNGQLVLVANGEHIPPARKPTEFAQIVGKFLEENQ